jgi:PAS domain S-box-containing protein
LLLAIVAAVGIGSMAAGWLTATLAALVRAVHQLETGCYATPLPRSDISEVARLSAAFLALRDRLAARTVERDQAEAALRVSEERYRTIVETAQEGIWLLDATCHTTFANAALARMLGYDVDEIIGMPITAFAQGDCPLMRMLNANGRCQQTTQHCEIALRRKDGSTLWAMVFINPLQGKYGDLAATLVTVVDITERKTVELELRESEARFRTMADSAPVLIWVSEADGSGIFFNQRWLEFTGRTLQQELGFGWVENLHPDDIPHVGESYKQAANQYKPYTVEFRMRRADGQYRWVIEQGVPRLRPNGTFAGYIGSCIDITERKHTEDMIQFMARASTELTASLDYHTTLASVTRLIVPDLADWCVVDILKEDGSIEQLAVAHADRTREALIRELRQHYPPDPDEPHVIWQVLSSGQSVMKINISDEQLAEHISEPGCLALRRQLGETGYMTVPLRARGRTLGVISFIVGNSGRCYTSKDLALAEELAYRAALAVDNARLYEEAQAAVRARDEFLSIASHELKTPLTALVGYIKLLTRRCEPGTMPTERDIRALRVIDEQSTRLHQLINLLLDMSRIQMGQLTIEPAPLDLAALSKRVACDIELTLEQHTLTLDLPPEPVCIVGDEVRLEQVLQNLLENAIKYSPDGGQVLVRLQQYGDCVLLSVSDEGIGIPGEAMQRLFQRFQRIANPHTCHVSGLGLGLYIVKEIVSLHGGSVDVESSEGRGSTFKVCLPREHPSALPAPAPR